MRVGGRLFGNSSLKIHPSRAAAPSCPGFTRRYSTKYGRIVVPGAIWGAWRAFRTGGEPNKNPILIGFLLGACRGLSRDYLGRMSKSTQPAQRRHEPLAWGQWGRCWWCGIKLSRRVRGRLRRSDTKYHSEACAFQGRKWRPGVSRGTGAVAPTP